MIVEMKELLFTGLLFAFFTACQLGGKGSSSMNPLVDFHSDKNEIAQESVGIKKNYEMPPIDKSMQLPNSLVEISGLTFDASANVLIGHDDELAILHFIDFEGNKIASKLKIGDIGDYEGVELVGDKIFLINSGGDILEHDIDDGNTIKFKTGLNANNNVEGLCYMDNKLLIACKGIPEMGRGQNFPGCRSIYSYSLEKASMGREPFMLLSFEKLRDYFGRKATGGMIKRLNAFAPSGIAIHPKMDDIYILSHKGDLMVVVDAQANIKKIYLLDRDDHMQPEGICFDTQNRLYIANEGNGSKPVIHRYQF